LPAAADLTTPAGARRLGGFSNCSTVPMAP